MVDPAIANHKRVTTPSPTSPPSLEITRGRVRQAECRVHHILTQYESTSEKCTIAFYLSSRSRSPPLLPSELPCASFPPSLRPSLSPSYSHPSNAMLTHRPMSAMNDIKRPSISSPSPLENAASVTGKADRKQGKEDQKQGDR